ncbi:MAG TPA: CotH kinase family protein, partial [Paludibacter sp.]|nr:CotH kinase family protein [Paludibacter sp.]
MYINTVNNQAIADKVNWVPANITVVSADTAQQLNMLTEIRGRGNSTWNLAKKPYRIKLDSKKHLLNLPAKDKNWVLLANYADKTLMRNAVAYKIGQILGFPFTPSVSFVDLTLNGSFFGNYMVTDQIEVGANRVDVDKQDSLDTTEPNITGGYLLEIDGFANTEPVWFTTEKGLKITVKYPDSDVINQAQVDYIKNYIASFENILFSANFKDPVTGYRAKVDTTTLINWYIACELTGNSDSFWSTYIYKKRLCDKLYFGPMWDYDIAFNNDSRLGDATQKLMRQTAFSPRTWIERLWLDEWFRQAVWKRWKEITANNLQGTLNTYINDTKALLNESQQLNFNKWNILNTRVYLENYLFNTYAGGVDYLKTYIGNRINYLNSALLYTEPVKPSEPFVASNYYYMVMNKKTNNSIDVNQNSVVSNSSLVMWEPIEDDNAQLWEIRQINDSLYRFVNRNSGLAMAGNGKGVNLIQVALNDADNSQKWKIKPVNTGNIYGIVNHKSGYSIDNSGGSFANGASVIEYTNNISGNENQQWYIQKNEQIATGLAQNRLLVKTFELYPNPAVDQVSVRFATDNQQDLTLKIYD